MDNRNVTKKKQEHLQKDYQLKEFNTFLCEETIDTFGYNNPPQRATWLMDIKKAKHFWSEGLYEMFAIAPNVEPDIMFWVDFLPTADLLRFTSNLNNIEEDGKPREFTFTAELNGRTKQIKCCMEAIKEMNNNETKFIAGTVYDITDGDFQESATAMKKLQKENERNRQLLSIIAHDLKNPFNTILGLTEFLLHRSHTYSSEKTELYLRTILSGARNAHTMLVRLLEWGKSQNENWQIVPVHLDLHRLISEVLEELTIIADTKKIELINQCEKDTFVNTDSEMLRIILRNLVSNSIKFSFKDSQIIVRVSKQQDHLQVSVTDFGIGMEDSIAEKIFLSEIKEPGTGTASERGTGLGLSICRVLVERIGGHIGVTSDLGTGSTFYFTIPEIHCPR